MQSNLHSKEITTAQVVAVSFGFFNDEEVGRHAGNCMRLCGRCGICSSLI